jgi:hypothetical protein
MSPRNARKIQMSTNKIICISGKRGSGKSLLAKYLGEYGFNKVSLADELKEYCKRDFGIPYGGEYDVFKEQPTPFRRTDGSFLTPRDIWIRCGIYYRSIDPLFWCRKIRLHEMTVIDDIRFINEVDYFRKLGAKFVRIERDPALNIYKAALDDLSETELDKFTEWDAKLETTFNVYPKDLEKFAEYVVEHV